MQNEEVMAVVDKYNHDEEYAKKVDQYIEEYMDDETYTLDDIEGILLTMPAESIHYLLSI